MSQVRRQSAVLPRPNWGWQDAAACRGEDLLLFFGPDGERQPERDIRERKAKEICAACPVRLECLNYAVSRPEKYGTWGGLNEDERSAERRRRMRRANAACGAPKDRGATVNHSGQQGKHISVAELAEGLIPLPDRGEPAGSGQNDHLVGFRAHGNSGRRRRHRYREDEVRRLPGP